MRVRSMLRVRIFPAERAGLVPGAWVFAVCACLLAVRPAQAGFPAPGRYSLGAPLRDDVTSSLSDQQKEAIADSVKRCYAQDTQAKGFTAYYADIVATNDASGEVRVAKLAAQSQARASTDLAYRAFAERALQAVLSPPCAQLPMPPNLLGRPSSVFTFRFRP